jgi:hypothetical protein
MFVMLIVAELFESVWLLKARKIFMLNMLMEFSLYSYDAYISVTSQPSVGSSIPSDTKSNYDTNVI